MKSKWLQMVLAAVFLAAFAVPASAQLYTGRIDVTAVDSTGAVLPGVLVELTGAQTGSATTDARGEAHFVGLAPGKYSVVAKLTGFGDYKNADVTVGTGTIVGLKATMAVGGVTATENVKAETPLIDTKQDKISTSVSLDELQKIPSSRDPWVVLQTIPGIIVDRVNVGGAESGQQSNFQAKGAAPADNTWNMDGIAITDMSATGSSPTYYDFDMFSEMQVTTGGSDVSTSTPGVQLNFVLRSGTNMYKGSGRFYWEDKGTQADNVSSINRGILGSFNRVKSYTDYGAEFGGPLMKDRVHFWGAYGKTEPKMQIFTRDPANLLNYINTAKDETVLENYSFKATGELNKRARASFTYFRGNKQKFGRGAAATRPDETTWNQTGPSQLFKGEANLTLSSNLFLTARYAHFKNGFSLTPRGGNTPVYQDADGVWHGSYVNYSTVRPQDTISADGNMFKGAHDLKFGFSWRKVNVTSNSSWPNAAIMFYDGYPNYVAQLTRDLSLKADSKYTTAYIQDSWSHDRLTINAGVRWDRQAASLGAAEVGAVALAPNLLPALTGTAASNAIVWNSITPRGGFTYALDDSRKTLVRGSYAMFASQLSSGAATVLGTIQYSYVYFAGRDNNGDKVVQASELTGNLSTGAGNLGYGGFNIANPTSLTTPNKIGEYRTPLTHEITVGADRQIMRDFAVSASWTYRKYTRFTWNPLNGVDGTDYTLAGTLAATSAVAVGSYSVPFYKINPAAVPADSGRLYQERPDYNQVFKGLEIAATKRMSNNWMMRAAWSTNDHREYFKSDAGRVDPTPTAANPNIDGGNVMRVSAGSGKSSIYMVLPKYQFIWNAAYQAKWGITAGANYLFRQGYTQPYVNRAVTGDVLGTNKDVLVVKNVTDYRLPSVHSFDVRLGKETRIQRATINIDVDAFNVFNLSTPLGRQYNLRLTNANQVLEIMNPRIVRFGVRVGF
jgi:hypothetical protein